MRAAARRAPGFTLIEVVIVLAVIAILAAIASPSYMEAVRKGWRGEARSALLLQMQQQERYFTLDGRYRPYQGDSGEGGTGRGRYAIESGTCDGQDSIDRCLRLQASLKPGFIDPQVGSFWIDTTGHRGCDGTPSDRCWQ